ncbi:hypothetical protein RRV45_08980 [Bacillus sp. DTU_2020_1000418_1_SI_GHA_SEK_038]|uniref:hypothetical protein n=1 Tax=Bacillus sp. DTU_2020_1000418_1_SI_GHA_SEK_038 TaxID=3077585 RepID=UPI0028EE9DB1|nr:hypothetical protein [Bacillus sp. DTU_2020_1000418_1_SI_GHA_SEK_038]WNS77102.1 hypothetical protein RRV45_08980 [Bacillus sp. DTU_2020_1000418_1_SI_GHA_SEK_038]
MDAKAEPLYSELRKTRMELLERLMDNNSSSLIKPIIKAELLDVEDTLNKIELGLFGRCEISGEPIPEELLTMVPTIKSLDDYGKIDSYFRKGIFH